MLTDAPLKYNIFHIFNVNITAFFFVLRRVIIITIIVVIIIVAELTISYFIVNGETDSEINNAPGTSCGVGTQLLDNLKIPMFLLYCKL